MAKRESKPLYFSTADMIEFLNKFDYVEKKYRIHNNKLIEDLRRFEESRQYIKLQKLSPAELGQTIDRVYGFSNEQRTDSAKIFSNVFSKIINEFLNINGLELLFNEHYYDFEWDMHLEFDVEKAQYNYYRDHMEHQVRNMYMMLKLLENHELLYEIKFLLNNKVNSKVSNYVFTRHKQFIDSEMFSGQKKELFLKCAQDFYKNLIKEYTESTDFMMVFHSKKYNEMIETLLNFFAIKSIALPKDVLHKSFVATFGKNAHFSESFTKEKLQKQLFRWFSSFCNDINNTDIILQSYLSDYSIVYIIYSATIISALFHDVSYPLCFFMKMQKRIGQYLPSMNAFIHNIEADIDRVVSILQPSLLFTLVSEKEIRAKLSKNQKDYDHGVFSAIALLLSYYESGRINQLSIDKQISIELAALAIYNHTINYNITDIDEKEYYRPLFIQNPISFLLRVCDDMQEWDRRYFELSKNDENIFCPDCGSPIVHYKSYENGKLQETLLCRCCGENNKIYYTTKFFPKRNMYTVTTCHNIAVVAQNNMLIFNINYDLLDLLHMVEISCTYSKYRAKELNKLKTIMLNQNFGAPGRLVNIKELRLNYTISSNPLYIKSKILVDSIINRVCHNNTVWDLHEFVLSQGKKSKAKIRKKYDTFINEFKNDVCKTIHDNKSEKDIAICVEDFIERFVTKFDSFLKKFKSTPEMTFLALYLYDDNLCINTSIEILQPVFWDYCINCAINYELIEKQFENVCQAIKNKITIKVNNKCTDIISSYIVNEVFNATSRKQLKNVLFTQEFREKFIFYTKLSSFILKSYLRTSDFLPEKDAFAKTVNRKYIVSDTQRNQPFGYLMEELMKDLYDIINAQTDAYSETQIELNKYTTQYNSKDGIYSLIEQYICPSNWYDSSCTSYKDFSDKNLDFHSDLFIFECLGQKLRNPK